MLGLAAPPAHAVIKVSDLAAVPTTITVASSSAGCSIANGDPMDIALIVVVGLLTLVLPLSRRRR